jgi:hypothetical protein
MSLPISGRGCGGGQRYHEYRDRLTETLRIAILGTPEVAEPKRALALVKT